MQRAPLRVGVMARGVSVPRWVADVVDDVHACEVAEIVGFVVAAEARPRRGARERVRAAGSRLLYDLYRRVDAVRFAEAVNPLEKIELAKRLRGLSVVTVASEGAISTIASWDLDVLL